MVIKKVAVIGSGTMGNGIAQVFAMNKYSVYLIDLNKELLEKAISNINSSLERLVKKEIIDSEKRINSLSNIQTIIGHKNIPHDIDLIIEAIYENKEAKVNVFKDLITLVNSNCIYATNTSSISITELASHTVPERFIGMHFMNPVPVMKLVEIIRGYLTSDEIVKTIIDLTKKIDKIPVEVNDYPGFVSNRILMPMINEAIYAYYEGVAGIEEIDTIMKLGMNHPMGPLALADLIGLDVCLNIMEVLYNGFNDSKYRPCPLLKKMVLAGKLGRKSGAGFYNYK